MKRILLVTVGLLALVAGTLLAAQYHTYEKITVADTAVGFGATTIRPAGSNAPADACAARVETASIRYRVGANPTATDGLLLNVGDVLRLESETDVAGVKFIRTGSVSATLHADCWRR